MQLPWDDDARRLERCFQCALVELHRWSIEDEIDRRLVAASGYSAELVRRIAKRYKVIRGLPAPVKANAVTQKAGNGDSAEILAELLNVLLKSWPHHTDDRALTLRATACAEVARHPKLTLATGQELASAITKLIWFGKPQGWTMYDRRAADGLGIPRLQTVDRMLMYYERLVSVKFVAISKQLNDALGESGATHMSGERLIDKYLMFCRSTDQQLAAWEAECELYLEAQPFQWKVDLERAQSAIQRKIMFIPKFVQDLA